MGVRSSLRNPPSDQQKIKKQKKNRRRKKKVDQHTKQDKITKIPLRSTIDVAEVLLNEHVIYSFTIFPGFGRMSKFLKFWEIR